MASTDYYGFTCDAYADAADDGSGGGARSDGAALFVVALSPDGAGGRNDSTDGCAVARRCVARCASLISLLSHVMTNRRFVSE